MMHFCDNRLEKFKNKYEGKRCFVVGTAPSLRYTDIGFLKNEYVFTPTWFALHNKYKDLKNVFYCIASPQIWLKDKLTPMMYNSMTANKNTTYMMESSFFALNKKYHYFPEEQVYYISFKDGKRDASIIDTDITKPIRYASTVIQDMLLPIVYYFGFNEIYLVGCDSSLIKSDYRDWQGSHFYDEKLMPPEIKYQTVIMSKGFDMKKINETYSKFKKFFENNNRKIYNAGYKGQLEIFERIDFNSLFEKGAK